MDFDKRKLASRQGSEEHRKWLKEWVESLIYEKSPEEVGAVLAERIDKLEQDRIRDPLTGVFNRGFVGVMLGLELAQAKETNQKIGVMMLDIDKFKSINDQEPDGHTAGDRTIIEFSKILKEVAGELAVVGRWGGEEFVVVLPYATGESIAEIAVDIGEATAGWLAERAKLQRPKVTASIGAYLAGFGETVPDIVDKVDKLMYQAKETGRNRLVLSDKTVEFS